MSFVKKPIVSKNEVNRAGKALAVSEHGDESDIKLVDQWRACHAYPINTFQSTLRTKLKKFSNEPLVAQRLKRMPTIIGKLRRFPEMKLSRMQDIGGIRAVLNSIDDVYLLASEYRNGSHFKHELVGYGKDYIKSPRDEDGYRSLHLAYKYKNKTNPEYDGLFVELQIRTKLQHSWATAVETMGTFLGQALKSRKGDKEWLDFFALVSSAFASMEKTALLPRHSKMSQKDIFKSIAKMNDELKILEKIKGYSVAVSEINKKGNSETGSSYHLIILNSIEKTVQIKPYKRGSIKAATEDYARIEAEAAKGKKIEAVLVSAGPLSVLKRAYPNFFLDISDFVKQIEYIIQESRK